MHVKHLVECLANSRCSNYYYYHYYWYLESSYVMENLSYDNRMLSQQAQEGNLDLGTREPWQVFEQERCNTMLKLHRGSSQCPPTGTASATVLYHRLHILGSSNAAGQKYSTNPTGDTPTTSSFAHPLDASWAADTTQSTRWGPEATHTASVHRCDDQETQVPGRGHWVAEEMWPLFRAVKTGFLLLCCVTLGKSLPLSELHLALMQRGP